MIGDEFDKQDVALSMDTHCLTNADNDTVYGGIESCALAKNVLRLGLSPEAAKVLGMPRQAALELAVTDDEIGTLKTGLRRIGVLKSD